ncbi:FKBP-type peptidyl-prolyl cis-trans isomerase FkpA [Duganella sp. 1224]|uniref:FKBP-type peptidyl-prolyl cis-trans isomerase n=1 Tax=Duganella sp. 1224 TaxID=2587052 RepID=UPI0015C7EAC4|nr:FKBP-type peptidyl-prolyl cis-trans isomerase [Duganella sp. 1224]NYE62056.1 FKBP-type peptidyl-prolyl cis-trans isomerase FkpA [Duganella sp. 1224]
MKRSSVFVAMLLAATLAQAQAPQAQPAAQPAQPEAAPVVVGSATPGPAAEQLIVTDTKLGTGAEATPGATVSMHYSGWLYRPLAKQMHGKLFDSSIPRGEPLEFVLGAGRVIKGWDQGIVGMKVGGKRTLIIPAELAYGSRPTPGSGIPPNSALIFDVELVGVK